MKGIYSLVVFFFFPAGGPAAKHEVGRTESDQRQTPLRQVVEAFLLV